MAVEQEGGRSTRVRVIHIKKFYDLPGQPQQGKVFDEIRQGNEVVKKHVKTLKFDNSRSRG